MQNSSLLSPLRMSTIKFIPVPAGTDVSLFREIRALIPIDWKGMSDEQKKKAIRSQLFLKEKYEDGKFVKMKARLVADRQMQDALLNTLISLPSQPRLGRSRRV